MAKPLPRVLIVEDEFLIALTAETELLAAGIDVVGKAATYASALDLARRTRPDLVVMDIRLGPGNDGIDAAIVLRQELGLPSVIATGSMDSTNQRRAEPASPLAWLPKPYTPEALVETVRAALYKLDPAAVAKD